MVSDSIYIRPDMTLEVRWAHRLHKLLDAYRTQCAESLGVHPADYTDANIREAEADMEATMSEVHAFIKMIFDRTGQLPIAGDKIQCAQYGSGARIEERIFYSPIRSSETLGVVYFLDTNLYDYLAESLEEAEELE